jgi:hypothetical protein
MEPSWLQDLIAPALSVLVFAISPVICVAVIIICIVWIGFDLRSRRPKPLEIVHLGAYICVHAVLLPFTTTADASRRFVYRASRLACEVRKYKSTEPQLRPDRKDKNLPPRRQPTSSLGVDSDVRRPYNYPKLRGDHDIRLFEIYPDGGNGGFLGYWRDGVKGRIIHSNLLWGPSYDAISYTWADEKGDSAETEEIYIMNERATVSVTSNCVRVLEKLRHPKKRRLVWIDAICIDQHSDPDRTHQVSLMARIYMSANKVIAYTGEATEESDMLFDWMNSVHPKDLVIPTNSGWADMLDTEGREWAPGRGQLVAGLEYFWYRLSVLSYKVSFRCSELWSITLGSQPRQARDEHATSLSDQEVLDAATEYFSRRWFQRVWVLQEVSLPDVRSVVIVCGSKSTSAMRALHSLSLLPSESLGALNLGRFYLMLRKKIMRPGKSHLLDVLIETRDRHCSDPRDKIFGVLSIASGLDEGRFPELVANYDLSTAQVYAEYSKFFIEHHGLAFFWSLIKSSPVVPNLPSWSADWSVPWPNYKAVRGRHLPATSRKIDRLDPSVSFENDFEGRDLLKLIRPAAILGVFTRDGHLDGSKSTTVEEVGDLQRGHHLVELCPGVCALLRESGDHYELIQVCPHHPEVDGLHQVIDAWTEYVVDGKIDFGNVAVDGKGRDYLSGLRTYLIR